MAAAGSFLLVMPRIMKNRTSQARTEGDHGKQFIAQITVTDTDPWLGTRSVAGMFPDFKHMTVRLVKRGYGSFLPPFEYLELREGDVVVVAATRQDVEFGKGVVQ